MQPILRLFSITRLLFAIFSNVFAASVVGVISLPIFSKAECVHVLKGLALPHTRHSGEIALAAHVAFHARGTPRSASPLSARCCHRRKNRNNNQSYSVSSLHCPCRKLMRISQQPRGAKSGFDKRCKRFAKRRR